MRTRIRMFAFGVTLLAGGASAAAAQEPTRLPPAIIIDTMRNSVTVENHRKVSVTMYLEAGTFDRRLGVIPAMATSTVPLPSWAVRGNARVRLFARPTNEVADLVSEEFTLKPPGRIAMVIPTRAEMQTVAPTDTMSAVIPPEELANATLTVDNPRNVPVTVYAESGTFDVRLGQVAPRSRLTLRFPKSVISPFGTVEIFLHPQNGIDLSSDALKVRPGDHLGIRVPLP